MRTVVACLLPALALPAQTPSPAFRYRPGDVLVATETTTQRETDARLGFCLASRHTTERRYTVLAVAADGTADVLVELATGPQELLEYRVRDRDEREQHLQKGFAPDATRAQRVLQARFTKQRFRCEPGRDEPAVFYLQELPELPAHALSLPVDGAATWQVAAALPRLQATWSCRREGATVRGSLQLAITDPRVRDGAAVPCPDGDLEWQFDAATGLPRTWQITLRHPRFPIDRPNEQVVVGVLAASAPLTAAQLAQLQQDLAAYTLVRDDFFAGRFAAALAGAATFAAGRPDSRLGAAVAAEVAAFHRQVPRYGQRPPEPATAHWLGGEPSTLAAQRGRVVVLDFWATWCVPCIAGMAHLIAAQQQQRAAGLQVLGLTRLDGKQSLDDVRAFHERGYAAGHGGLAIAYPLVVLGDDTLHTWFAVRAIPKLVVLDRDGRVHWEQTGAGGEARLDRILAALLAERGEATK